MGVRGGVLTVVYTSVTLAGAHLARAQEAASAHLSDQLPLGEMAPASKPKDKQSQQNSRTPATAREENRSVTPKRTPLPEQLPPAPTRHANAEPSPFTEAKTRNLSSAHVTRSVSPPEEAAPVQRKQRPQTRQRSALQPEPVSPPEPVPMSLSVAQSMASRAPLPEYPYEAKLRGITGSGVCVLTVDPATGKVTNASMEQSTGSRLLDKVTIETFKTWRFRPGTVSEVRLPISYE